MSGRFSESTIKHTDIERALKRWGYQMKTNAHGTRWEKAGAPSLQSHTVSSNHPMTTNRLALWARILGYPNCREFTDAIKREAG